jgi:hypothetical protein
VQVRPGSVDLWPRPSLAAWPSCLTPPVSSLVVLRWAPWRMERWRRSTWTTSWRVRQTVGSDAPTKSSPDTSLQQSFVVCTCAGPTGRIEPAVVS